MSINGEYADINGGLAIINAKPPLKAIVAASDNYPKGWHEGNPGGLDTIDTDLAAGNIKDGVTIFGKLGTLTATLADDVTGYDLCDLTNSSVLSIDIAALTEVTIATRTLVFAAGSRQTVFYTITTAASAINSIKVRLYAGGVQLYESAYLPSFLDNNAINVTQVFTQTLSGSQACTITVYNYHASLQRSIYIYGAEQAGQQPSCGVFIGSIKIA